jgi:hypothetical protein
MFLYIVEESLGMMDDCILTDVTPVSGGMARNGGW